MTQLMKRAISRLQEVPEEQQDGIAAIILDEVLPTEDKWDDLLASDRSQTLLDQMAQEALAEFDRGETTSLDAFLDEA